MNKKKHNEKPKKKKRKIKTVMIVTGPFCTILEVPARKGKNG